MAKADRVYNTPPTNTPVDTTRRRFLAVAAFASVAGAGSLAAAAMTPNDVPQAVTLPKDSGFQADPIYEIIERHRTAAREHTEAVSIHFAFEDTGGIEGERLKEYQRLVAETDAAYDRMEDAGLDLINTKATTLPGLLALCQYIKLLFAEDEAPDLPEYISYDDGKTAYPAEAFAHTIGRSIEEMMKVEGTV